MWAVARRPRWIAALALALVVAAGFAALSQWQLGRSVSTGTVVDKGTESVVPLSQVAKPQSPISERAATQRVSASGHWIPKDYALVSDRLNNGTAGYWVVGHFSAQTPAGATAGLVVAVGWSPNRADAATAVSALSRKTDTNTVSITGRYLPPEAAEDSDFEHGKVSTVSPAALLNTWTVRDPAGIYGGYLVSAEKTAGLAVIDSPKPTNDVEVNLLNVFYAIEWVVFAGFAIFLWYRLVRDTWEREQEEAAEAAEAQTEPMAQTAEVN
jgi:cytochrome oxidase assembly protein ShyY1